MCYYSVIMSFKRQLSSILLALVVGAFTFIPTITAYNDSTDLPGIVSEDPVDWTPQVPGTWDNKATHDDSYYYQVMTMVPLGDLMYAGGNFPLVKSGNGNTSYNRNNIFSFNAQTGVVTNFAPDFDGQVNAILPSKDGKALYVGGEFSHVNGVARSKLAKIDATTGALINDFKNTKFNGKVNDLDYIGNRLIVAGKFTKAGTKARTGFASLNATTGSVTNFMNVTLSGQLNAASTQGIWRFALSPDQTKLAATGSFLKVNGESRLQLFVLNVSSTGTTLANWDAPILHIASCSQKTKGNAAVIGDLDFSGDSRKLYIGTGGGPHGASICDAAIQFDVTKTGKNVVADWVNYTGGDTIRSIVWTSNAIYVAGHQRWLTDVTGTLADRAGIGALNPSQGYALGWNPGHDREIGSQLLIVTDAATQPGQPTGLWVGSDSGGCGKNIGETRRHQGICFFPN